MAQFSSIEWTDHTFNPWSPRNRSNVEPKTGLAVRRTLLCY